MNHFTNDNDMDRYLNEEMTEQERVDFETALSQNSLLRKQLEEHQMILEGIRCYGRKETWQKIQQLEVEASSHSIEDRTIVTKWLFRSMAASVLLLMIGFSYYWHKDERMYTRLFERNFEAYQPLGGPVRGGNAEEFVLDRAFAAYYKKRYEQAIDLFKQANTQEDNYHIWFYLGNAYLGLDQAEDAIQALQKVLTYQQVEENIRIRTHWYLGLAYLKQKNKEAALDALRAIQNTDNKYGQKARELLKSID